MSHIAYSYKGRDNFISFYLSMIIFLSVALVAFSLAKAIGAIDDLNQ